jgi:hypothetical protein
MTVATPPGLDRVSLAAALPSLALRVVHLPQPLEFGRCASEDLALLRLLRDATSHAVRLRWTLRGEPVFPPETHVHLVPPVGGAGASGTGYALRWAREYRYGCFYYRRGPGMVTVKDVRPGVPASRMVIEDGAETFLRLAEDPHGTVRPDEEAMVADAVAADLALRIADVALILPFRMRHWPVPYLAA